MEHIKTINVFDFDETIVRVPSYTSKKHVEKTHGKISFDSPYAFYDHSSSLDEDIHHIQLIEPVYKEWKKSDSDETALTVLITHRVSDLKGEVKSILDNRGLFFDRYHFLGRVKKKSMIIEKLLLECPNVKKVRVFEDSIHQLDVYQSFFKENKVKAKLEMYIVDKSKMYRLNKLQISEETRIKLI